MWGKVQIPVSPGDGLSVIVTMVMCFNAADSLQNHRSMVLHILSQLKLGMDLTRVSGLGMEFCIYDALCR